MRKRNNKHSKRGKSSLMITFLCVVFLISLVSYLLTSLVLKSYNTELSVQNQQIQQSIAETQTEIEELQDEISVLEDKNRVLGMLDYQVYDNKDNIYVIGDDESQLNQD